MSSDAADLADTVGGLDTELEWSHVLSLGEQQRLAFLRLLLHEPALAFLDEATGALDSATEASCYKGLQKHSTSFVSVGKSPAYDNKARHDFVHSPLVALVLNTVNAW